MPFLFEQTMEVHQHMTRSFSVPVDGKATNLRVTDSRGLIRVISAKPHRETVGGKSTDGAFVPEIGNSSKIYGIFKILF